MDTKATPILSFVHDKEMIHVCKVELYDAWSICDFVSANEDRLSLFFPLTKEQNLTPDLSSRFVSLKVKQYETREEFLFIIKIGSSQKVRGLFYLKELDWKEKQGEFAYAIDYNLEGKGITSKIVKELSDYAFEKLKLKTLQIIAHKTNIPSLRIAEKCNFVWVKTLKKSFFPKGKKPMDMELYELYNK